MKKRFSGAVVVALLLLGGRAFTQNVSGPAKAKATTPEIPFDSVPNFFKLPADLNFGEDAGVALNSKGHVFVYTRSNSATMYLWSNGSSLVSAKSGGMLARLKSIPSRLVTE